MLWGTTFVWNCHVQRWWKVVLEHHFVQPIGDGSASTTPKFTFDSRKAFPAIATTSRKDIITLSHPSTPAMLPSTSISSDSSSPSSKRLTKWITSDDMDAAKAAGKVYIVYREGVFDITTFQHRHPGGYLTINHLSGTDATDAITVFHEQKVVDKYISTLPRVGIVSRFETNNLMTLSRSPVSVAFRALYAQLELEDLLSTHITFYYWQFAKLALILLSSVCLLLFYPHSWYGVTMSAMMMAFFWQQAAFVAHDAGHSGITQNLSTDHFIGCVLANLCGGVSIGWWKDSHNVHHTVPNDPAHDPDIQHLPFLAISEKFLGPNGIYSTYHKRLIIVDAISAVLIQVQVQLYYFLMLLGRINLYLNSFKYLMHSSSGHMKQPGEENENEPHKETNSSYRKIRMPHTERVFLLLFWTWFLALICRLPTVSMIMYYFFLSHALTFILHIQINLSHYTMDVVSAFENEEAFMLHQLRTTQDIDCPPYLDWLHGGLQFQAIHHLFPRMPRHNLRATQARVISLCTDHGITYKTISFAEGNANVIRKLASVSAALRHIKQFITK